MDSFPYVSIVVLNWNNAPDTLECLRSIFESDYTNYSVIIVDNGSMDNSVNNIRLSYPEVELLETGANLGYAGGSNVGIRHAVNQGSDYVLILNNDTLVKPDMLTELVQVAEMNPRIGMVGPKMYCFKPKDKLFEAGGFIRWNKGEIWHRGMFQPGSLYSDHIYPEPVDFITGCCVLVSRRLIEVAGYLDPSYYLNFEDVEWAVRARRSGFEVWYVPKSIMWHKISATLGKASSANTYYMTRNALLFFWRYSPPHLRWIPISRIILRTLRTIGAWTLKSKYRTETFRRKRNANILALRDFFLRRYGEMGADVAKICYR